MKKPPFRLVEETISTDTCEALTELLREARAGQVIGLAFVAMCRGRTYFVNCTGEALRNPTFTRGMVRALDDVLADMVGSRHKNLTD